MKKIRKNLEGATFGLWKVVAFSHTSDMHQAYWLCRCACGVERSVLACNLSNGVSNSCGCMLGRKTHGLSKTRVFRLWLGMRERCRYPYASHYRDYGGRGITVCDRWNKFENFFADMGHPPSSQHSIDRLDVNGNYEPGNCVWATKKQQARNQRRAKLNQENVDEIRALGRSVDAKILASRFGVTRQMIYRIWNNRVWLPEEFADRSAA